MEDVREPRSTGCPDLTAFCWRSEGDELDMCECLRFVVMCAAASGLQHSALSCAVSLSVSFFPVYPAERCVLNGKVTVMLKGVSVVV